MARIKTYYVLDTLSSELTRAITATLDELAPGARIDPNQFYQVFLRNADRFTSTWERVRDDYVEL